MASSIWSAKGRLVQAIEKVKDMDMAIEALHSRLRNAERMEKVHYTGTAGRDMSFGLRHAMTGGGADGAWWCCRCARENNISHWKGEHPFKHLECAHCSQLICKQCHTTGLLTWAKALELVSYSNGEKLFANPVQVPQFAGAEVPYGSVCGDCGLTYRATHYTIQKKSKGPFVEIQFETSCVCDNSNALNWRRFQIGTNDDWQVDPDACRQRWLERREAQVDQHQEHPIGVCLITESCQIAGHIE
ncbi:hypothetical protein EJ04DRAFT_558879 [Polyplosphaeria fusca]|uniref:Probable double zinc ribbon domain-containing protein n=1 Tax=Polyplosphaeria fusca TaxID=682080 RepID=A0A9P4V6Z6_9PLEO|nr:hypothetical protein EJ04DRAFT_558879 [Polyplosphaeria fusca]